MVLYSIIAFQFIIVDAMKIVFEGYVRNIG